MRRLLFFSLFIPAFLAGLMVARAGRYRDVYRSICDLTEEHFYKENEKLEAWVKACRVKAAQVPVTASPAELLALVQDHLNELATSHFSIYSPVEDRKLWKGESVDTGIRSRYVEDKLVVYKVMPQSSALAAGVKAGDEIVGVPGSDQVTPWGAEHRAGIFKLRRAGKDLEVKIEPSPLIVDFSPQLQDLGGGHGLLTISSFRSEFFPSDEWREMAKTLSAYKHIIIDVRENAGGNFVAMLRALSTFECGQKLIGRLVQPRKAAPDKPAFDDDTADAHQLKELDRYHSIGLRTFDSYGCYRGRATVLISSDTSSVAEIFADSFKSRPGSRVWGQPSAGDVVLAVWYDLPALGPGYSFSIPEAVYLNRYKKELEGEGVFPQKDLFYDLQLALQGRDSWVVEAMK